MTRSEYSEFRSIRADLKKYTLGHGTTLTIRTDASADYKAKLHGLYTSLNFHPASVRVDSHYFDDKERIIYIYGADEIHHDYYGRPFTWEALYTAEAKARFAAALTDEWEAFKDAQEAQEAPQEAPAAEAEQLPTETENAPQAATQAAKGTTTDEQKEDDTMITTAFTPAEAAIHAATARGIIRKKGGYRERDIINHPHTVERGTWTTEHKVVEIIATTPDPDGYRAGCAVDIVTRSIVG